MESPNTLILNSHKGNTADILKISKKEDFDNVSKQLVSREPIMNGLTKTVEFVTDNLLQSAEMDFKDKRKFRKESLQVKIFNNKNGEMISPSLKKDLEDYKMKNEKQPDSTKVITPMLVIKENNEEEEEKKN